ncbi:Asx homology domain-containing protein [Hypoxylon sp. NC1633]|nr:Asx homology domain-containing protein [Hypoxylon sp. NC1633]
MPPRKKGSVATANKPTEATRRSARNSKRPTPVSNDASSDELSSQNLPLRGNSSKSIQAEGRQPEEIVDEITVRTTRTKSYSSSRPSTAQSEANSQSHQLRVVSTPVTNQDIVMLGDRDRDEDEDELVGEAPAPKKTKAALHETPTSGRKGRSKYDNPDEMLTNPRAPLATTKLRDLLCSKKAWDLLSPEEKKQVLSKFPDNREVLDAGTDNARPDVAALRNNDNFRHDVARYQEDLSKGWHDSEWIRQAQAAHMKREIGVYDEYLAARFEEEWGMPMPEKDEGRDVEAEADGEEDPGGMEAPEQEGSEKNEEKQEADPEAMTGVEIIVQDNAVEPVVDEVSGKEDSAQKVGVEEHLPDITMANGETPQ